MFHTCFRKLKALVFTSTASLVWQDFEKSQLLANFKRILEPYFPDLLDFPALVTKHNAKKMD